MNIQQTIKSLPLTSGVYLMKDKDGGIIYVGKAISLRKRVQSYFRKDTGSYKTDILVSMIDTIDHIEHRADLDGIFERLAGDSGRSSRGSIGRCHRRRGQRHFFKERKRCA